MRKFLLFLLISVGAAAQVAPYITAKPQFFDNSGIVCSGCKLYSYTAGTTTPLATYSDSTGLYPNPNPLVLNASGYPLSGIFLGANTYKFVFQDANSNTLWSVDGVGSLQTFYNLITNFPSTTHTWSAVQTYAAQPVFSVGISGTGNTGALTPGSGILGNTSAWTASQNLNAGFTSSKFYYDPSVKHLKTWSNTYGTFDSAAASSISAAGASEPATQVMGIATPSQLSTYASRDSVALYAQNTAQAPWLTTANTTFTSTTVVSTDFASISSIAKVGMILDVQGTPVISGIVTAINGNTYTVSGWYKVDGSSGTQTPTNGASAVVNPATTVWSLNTLTTLPTTGYATKGVGAEIDLSLLKTGSGPNSLGVTVVNTPGSTETGYAAVNTTGNWARGFVANQNGASSLMVYGFQATNCSTTCFLSTQTGHAGTGLITQNGSIGFNSQGDATGFVIDDATTTAFTVRQSAVQKFALDNAGNIALAQSLTLGNSSTALTRYAKYTASITPAAVAANVAAEQAFTFTGVQTGDIILRVLPPSAMSHVGITNSRVSGANSVTVQFQGDGTGGTPPAGTYTVVVVQ